LIVLIAAVHLTDECNAFVRNERQRRVQIDKRGLWPHQLLN
jgi:hypothetical protein